MRDAGAGLGARLAPTLSELSAAVEPLARAPRVEPAAEAPACVLDTPIVPQTQNDPATVTAAAEHLRGALGVTAGAVAVFADAGAMARESVEAWTGTSGAAAATHAALRGLEVSYITAGDTPVVLFYGDAEWHAAGRQPSDGGCAVRVAAALGCTAALIAVTATGLPKGVYAVRDHAVLTGRSPLTGHNPEGHGPRFPDMSAAHTPRVAAAITAVLPGASPAAPESALLAGVRAWAEVDPLEDRAAAG
jgi:hypothetical protein